MTSPILAASSVWLGMFFVACGSSVLGVENYERLNELTTEDLDSYCSERAYAPAGLPTPEELRGACIARVAAAEPSVDRCENAVLEECADPSGSAVLLDCDKLTKEVLADLATCDATWQDLTTCMDTQHAELRAAFQGYDTVTSCANAKPAPTGKRVAEIGACQEILSRCPDLQLLKVQ